MAITGVNGGVSSNYTNYYTTKNVGNTKDNSNVSTSTVELKTSTGGTRTEQIKTGFSNVNDYSQYLQGKYSYMNTGTTSMQGVPTTVSVSSAFLQKCMNDPEKAKYLEENLAAIPDCVKSLNNYVKMAPGSPVVTYATYKIDENGNISIMSGSTNDPDGKIARENAERKAKESREKEKKAEEKRTAKRAEENKAAEKAEEKRLEEQQAEKEAAEKMTTVYVTGTSMKDVTEKVISGLSNTSTIPNGGTVVVGFDVKA